MRTCGVNEESNKLAIFVENTAEERSSVARKLGVTMPNIKEPTHYIDGIVEYRTEIQALLQTEELFCHTIYVQ